MKQLTSEQALHRLSNYCSRTERCIFDVRRKLIAWEIPENEQNQIIRKLQQEKFLDESRYCRAFVNDKSKYNHWGAYKIKVELKKKQIPEDRIREALENLQPEETLEQLCRLLEQKKKSVNGKNDFEIKQKLMRFAAGRGFSQEETEKALLNCHFAPLFQFFF
jgi:regulatory protein